jgi:hypothetical protein
MNCIRLYPVRFYGTGTQAQSFRRRPELQDQPRDCPQPPLAVTAVIQSSPRGPIDCRASRIDGKAALLVPVLAIRTPSGAGMIVKIGSEAKGG